MIELLVTFSLSIWLYFGSFVAAIPCFDNIAAVPAIDQIETITNQNSTTELVSQNPSPITVQQFLISIPPYTNEF
jgi:hypothetical protein